MKSSLPQITGSAALLAALLIVPLALNAGPKSKSATWRGQSLTEFDPAENEKFGWQIVNDGVMGGLSKGKVTFTDSGTMQFSGNLSLQNNGGFSTVRSGNVKLDLSDDEGLLFLVKGDGRTYDARLTSDARFRGMEVSFTAEFPTTAGKWQEVKVPFSAFKGSFRGMDLKDVKLNPAKIQRFGILLGDKKEGPFVLEIDWIRTFGKGKGPDSDKLTKAESGSSNLVDTVVADGRFKILAAALTKAELLDVLKGGDALTVFAPTDAAFSKLPKKTVEELLLPENKEKLVSILTYHVSPGANLLGDALKARSVPTVQGADVSIAFAKGQVRINDASLIDSDLECSNGVIHVIDSVLLPPAPKKAKRTTVLTVAEEAGSFSTLLAAIGAADLESVLEGEGPFTVFAPTEEAFAALPKGTVESLLKKENRKKLAAVLSYHVVPGRVSAGDALNAGKAKTVQGGVLQFAVNDGRLQVNDSNIKSVDIDGGNGVIHVIDSVLLPPKAETGEGEKAASACAGCSPKEAILTAIDKGVPLYNNGDPAACASVYQTCIEKLSTCEKIDSHVRRLLVMAMERGKRHDSASDRAWLYRSALDSMMAYLSRINS